MDSEVRPRIESNESLLSGVADVNYNPDSAKESSPQQEQQIDTVQN